jgi:hypothetical protein
MASLPWDSAYARSHAGGPNGIPLDVQLAAMVVDALHALLYRDADPKKRGDQPTPVLGALMGHEAPATKGRSRRTPQELYAALQEQATQQPD